MKKYTFSRISALVMGFVMIGMLPSCTVIEGIFKAGVWTGILIVALIVGLLIWLLTRAGGKK